MVIGPCRPAPLNRRDEAHRVISNEANTAFTNREAQSDFRWTACRVGSVLLITTYQVDFSTLCTVSCVRMPFSWNFTRFLMYPLSSGNGIPFICLAGGLPYAHFVIPTPLRWAKVVDSVFMNSIPTSVTAKQSSRESMTVRWLSSLRSASRNYQLRCQPTPTPQNRRQHTMGGKGVLIWCLFNGWIIRHTSPFLSTPNNDTSNI